MEGNQSGLKPNCIVLSWLSKHWVESKASPCTGQNFSLYLPCPATVSAPSKYLVPEGWGVL